MIKTIEEQVEETVIDLTQHIQSIDGVALDELIDNIRTALQERDRIAREEAIKECEGCVQKEQERIRKEMLRGYDDSYHHSSQKDGSTTYITEKQFDFILKEALLPRPNTTSDK